MAIPDFKSDKDIVEGLLAAFRDTPHISYLEILAKEILSGPLQIQCLREDAHESHLWDIHLAPKKCRGLKAQQCLEGFVHGSHKYYASSRRDFLVGEYFACSGVKAGVGDWEAFRRLRQVIAEKDRKIEKLEKKLRKIRKKLKKAPRFD